MLCFAILATSLLLVGCGCKHNNLSPYFYDSEYHWRVCEDCDDIVGKEKHEFETEIIDDSTMVKTCKVCHMEESSELSAAVLPNNFLSILSESGINLNYIDKLSFDFKATSDFNNTGKLIGDKIQVWRKGNELSLVHSGTIKVENCVGLFKDSNLQEIVFNNFDTSNVTDMNSMFFDCSELTTLDLSGLNTSNVSDMHSMFTGCSKLKNLNLSNFDTSNVMNMSYMFHGCLELTSLNLLNFDTSNVSNMQTMFLDCSKLKELNLSNFDTSNVTNMSGMFNGCSSLSGFFNIRSFDTSNVTNMSAMFKNCSSLVYLDLTSFDTSKVDNMSSMFQHCRNLETILVSEKWVMAQITFEMFNGSLCNDVTIYV